MTGISSSTGRGNILVVDDNHENLRLLSTMLTEQGYKARSATNGKLALASVQSAPPDLILLDVNMPGMTGYEVCKALKAHDQTRAIPIIFISARDEVLVKVQAFSVGGIDYITKPFQFEEVLARVKTHLTLHRLQQQLESTNQTLEQQVRERTATYERFVPQDILRLLQAEHLGTIQPGAYVQREVTTLLARLSPARDSSSMVPPHAAVQALQGMVAHAGADMRQQHGVIDTCYADALVALFPRQADDALHAARALLQQQDDIAAIGLHTAQVVLGVVGDDQRLHTVEVSYARTVAAHLAALAETHGASLLISAPTLAHLAEPEQAHWTQWDQVSLPGYADPVAIFARASSSGQHQRSQL
jgi:DNA-binding response OmpR family regulator